MDTRKIGSTYEEKAARYLKEQGLLILKQNFRCPKGEIDLIAKDGAYLVFVEVKYRDGKRKGASLWAVDRKKQKRISKTAMWYLVTEVGSVELPCRFDVIGIEKEEIRWIPNAFDFVV